MYTLNINGNKLGMIRGMKRNETEESYKSYLNTFIRSRYSMGNNSTIEYESTINAYVDSVYLNAASLRKDNKRKSKESKQDTLKKDKKQGIASLFTDSSAEFLNEEISSKKKEILKSDTKKVKTNESKSNLTFISKFLDSSISEEELDSEKPIKNEEKKKNGVFKAFISVFFKDYLLDDNISEKDLKEYSDNEFTNTKVIPFTLEKSKNDGISYKLKNSITSFLSEAVGNLFHSYDLDEYDDEELEDDTEREKISDRFKKAKESVSNLISKAKNKIREIKDEKEVIKQQELELLSYVDVQKEEDSIIDREVERLLYTQKRESKLKIFANNISMNFVLNKQKLGLSMHSLTTTAKTVVQEQVEVLQSVSEEPTPIFEGVNNTVVETVDNPVADESEDISERLVKLRSKLINLYQNIDSYYPEQPKEYAKRVVG